VNLLDPLVVRIMYEQMYPFPMVKGSSENFIKDIFLFVLVSSYLNIVSYEDL
jgi:hypothetical protein